MFHKPSAIFDPLNTRQLLHALLKGECEGEPLTGQVAVASVVRTRAERIPHVPGIGRDILDYRAVILAWAQFSCMWEALGGAAYTRVVEFVPRLLKAGPFSHAERQLAWIATGVMSGDLIDPTHGATHYFATYVTDPAWTKEMTFVTAIGNHSFYRAA